ncbi:hypothetical protein IM660_12330 [Ruania alkalisoli]|uniref:ATP synthase F0 subunit B n=1 Tax=Ruania alkalisoli TaxID=2779775 RepID=A0A7M1SR54_9MICO|nr:hypothetical protein [Ruania alkalisoli]QOR69474.1 hypothetical protein IM660_12330 [Ruania alkalisoli]
MSKAAEQGESLVAILDELADLVSSARSMPMSASVLVNRAEVLELIDSATGVLPDQITRADSVVADADAVLQRARREAGAIVEKAKERADELVSREAVVAAANERAATIVATAKAEAEKLSREADDYCDRQLAQFEIDLNSISSQVAAGRARLMERTRGRRGPADETNGGNDKEANDS